MAVPVHHYYQFSNRAVRLKDAADEFLRRKNHNGARYVPLERCSEAPWKASVLSCSSSRSNVRAMTIPFVVQLANEGREDDELQAADVRRADPYNLDAH